MSSGQSAVGTRTCSGDPAADWRLANGEGTVTSGGCREPNLPVNYASGRSAAVGSSLLPPARRLDKTQTPGNSQVVKVRPFGVTFGHMQDTLARFVPVLPAGV